MNTKPIIIIFLLIVSMQIVVATSCGHLICGNDTFTGPGDLHGMTWAQINDEFIRNYYNNNHGWNQSQTFTNTLSGKSIFWVPWMVNDNDMNASNLKSTYISPVNWTTNTMVTDEGSEFMTSIALNMSDTEFTQYIQYLIDCADTTHTTFGTYGTGWVCSRNGNTTAVNDQNSASDATSRIALSLFILSKSPKLNSTNRAIAGARAINITNWAIGQEVVTDSHQSPWNASYNLSKWRLAGANQTWGAGALQQNGQQMFIGYNEADMGMFLAAYAYTHNSTYSQYAGYSAAQLLYAVQYKGGTGSANFTMAVNNSNYYMNCSTTVCTTKSNYNNGGLDDADGPRMWATCNNINYANNTYTKFGETLTYEFQMLNNYCTAWSARIANTGSVSAGTTLLWNGTKGCAQIASDGTCRVTNNNDEYRPMGLISNVVAYKGNASDYNTAMNYLQYYNATNDYFTQGGGAGSPAIRGFGIYGQVRSITSIRAATGFYDFLWTNTTYNYTNWASGVGINLTVNLTCETATYTLLYNGTNSTYIWNNAITQSKIYCWYVKVSDNKTKINSTIGMFNLSFMNWSVTYSPGIFGFTILPASSSGTFYPVNQSGVYGTFNITNNENTTINLSVNLSKGLSKYVDLQFYGNNLNYGMVPLYRTPHTGVRTGGQSGSYFNGSQGITSAINITSNSPFTISIWFTNTNKSAQDLIRFYNNSNTVGEIRRGFSDPLQLFSCWVNISGPDNCMSPSYTFSQFDNLTYNYVLAYDGINLTAYLNGTLIDTPNNITQYGTVIYNNTNITSIIIGNGNNYFNGSIYKVQIWNRTLTNVEINSEYLIKMDNPTLLSNGLILQYLLSHTESAFGNTTNVFDVDAATFNQSIQKVSYTDYYDKFNGSVSNVSGNTNETTNYTTEPIQKTVSISRATMAVNVSLTNGTFKLYVNNTLVYNTTNNTPQNVIVDFTTVLRSYLGNCTGPTCSIPLMINETNVTSYTLSNLAIRANGMTGSTNETYITTILPNTTVYVFARAIYTNSGLGGTYTVNWKATK